MRFPRHACQGKNDLAVMSFCSAWALAFFKCLSGKEGASNKPTITLAFPGLHGDIHNTKVPSKVIRDASVNDCGKLQNQVKYPIIGLHELEDLSKSVIKALAMSFANPLSLISLSSLTTTIPLSLRPSSTASNNA